MLTLELRVEQVRKTLNCGIVYWSDIGDRCEVVEEREGDDGGWGDGGVVEPGAGSTQGSGIGDEGVNHVCGID